MNPSDFLNISATLVGRGASGARSAVSRAYYGAFHLAADLLVELQCSCPTKQKSHKFIPMFLKSSTDDDAITAGGLLDDLRAERNKADYDLDISSYETMGFAQTCVATAMQIRVHLDAFKAACADQDTLDELREGVQKIRQAYKM